MKKINIKELFTDTHQLTRIIILASIVLVLAIASFGGYYYYDRYYRPQAPVAQQNLAQAEQAVRDDPQNVDKRLALAQTYMIYSRFDDAVTQALQVQSVHPENVMVDFVLGVSYANNGRPKDAIEPLGKFIDSRKDEDMAALDKQLQAAYYYLGDSYLQLGQPENAITPLLTTVNESQTDADAIYKLGLAYSGVKRYDEAIASFQQAILFVPNFSEAYQAMGSAYQAKNEPNHVLYTQGMMAYSKKDYQAALSTLLQVSQAEPGFVPALIGLGQTYEATKDLPNALSFYQTVLKFDPNNFTANDGVKRVQAAMQK